MIYGFCMTARDDEPVDSLGRCLPHDARALPPSFGRATQRWIGGTWEPFIARPAGYVYRPRSIDPAAAQRTGTALCGWCGDPFTVNYGGGTPPAYCTSIHRVAALNARRRALRQERAS